MSQCFLKPCRMSIGSMSHVEFKKWPCRPVEFKGQGPPYRRQWRLRGALPLQRWVPKIKQQNPSSVLPKPSLTALAGLQPPLFFLEIKGQTIVITMVVPQQRGFFSCPDTITLIREDVKIAGCSQNAAAFKSNV